MIHENKQPRLKRGKFNLKRLLTQIEKPMLIKDVPIGMLPRIKKVYALA